jgi:hypothetical protein
VFDIQLGVESPNTEPDACLRQFIAQAECRQDV